MERESESANSLKFVVNKVAFVNKIPLLQKATSDDESPTPGYLYQEISNLTREKGSFCNDVLDYLVMRLDKKSYHVKLKVLRILRFIIDNGHPEFRQGLRRKAHGIREATKFGGPPDPLHGNAPYILVRKEAKELSQILFDVNAEISDGQGQGDAVTLTATAMSGMGSSSRGVMQGFGNVPHTEKSLSESLVGGLRSFADKVLSPPAPSTNHLAATQQRDGLFSEYKPVHFDVTEADTVTQYREFKPNVVVQREMNDASSIATKRTDTRVKAHRPGVAGGGWEDSDDEHGEDMESGPESVQHPAQAEHSEDHNNTATIMGTSASYRLGTPPQEENAAEVQLVSELVNQPGKPLLRTNDTDNFIKRCSMLNCIKVAEAVGNTLVKSSFTYQLHGLQLVESLLRTDLLSSDEVMNACCEGLAVCFRSQNGQTQVKARKIIRVMEKLCVDPSPIANIIPTADNASISESSQSTEQTKEPVALVELNSYNSQHNMCSSRLGNNIESGIEVPGVIPALDHQWNTTGFQVNTTGFSGCNLLQTTSSDSDPDTFMSNFSFIKPPFAGDNMNSNTTVADTKES